MESVYYLTWKLLVRCERQHLNLDYFLPPLVLGLSLFKLSENGLLSWTAPWEREEN